MSSARISNSKDIYIYIYAQYSSRRKKSGKFSGRKRRNESSFLGSRDKSYSRTSNGWKKKKRKYVGKFKEILIPAGLTREGGREGGPIVEQRRSEKFQFYGRLKNRRWRLAGVKNYRGDSAGFTRGRSSFSKPLITPPPFSSNIHSFVHSCRTAFRTLPQLIPVNKNACPLFEGPPPLEGRKHEGRVKRALVRRRSNCLFRYR